MPQGIEADAILQLRASLVAQARRRLGDNHEAEDVAQDALVALYTTDARFNDLDHVAAYARRTVHNLCVDRIQRRVRHLSLEHADVAYEPVEHEVINRELVAAVVSALAQINPAYASVLIASTDVGRNHSAIAAATGVSLRNVRHGLDRGTKALKAKLAAAGQSIPAVALPLPVRAVIVTVKARLKAPRARMLGGAAALGSLPLLLLLIPQAVLPSNRPAWGDTPGSTATATPASVARAGSSLASAAAFTQADPLNDQAFAADAARLLGSTHDLKGDQCLLFEGHGICQTDPDPTFRYYTVKVPPNPYLPDVQVYNDNLPPCDDTVPSNPAVTCEQGHPPTPFPVPTPTLLAKR